MRRRDGAVIGRILVWIWAICYSEGLAWIVFHQGGRVEVYADEVRSSLHDLFHIILRGLERGCVLLIESFYIFRVVSFVKRVQNLGIVHRVTVPLGCAVRVLIIDTGR